MNRLIAVAVGLAGVVSGALGVSAAPNPVLVSHATSHTKYLPLNSWASRHGFEIDAASAAHEVVVRNQRHRISLYLDSSRMLFDGVQVWLSHPVLVRNGRIHVAELDLSGVLDPLADPPSFKPPRTIRTICLDPGHGGWEPGQKSGDRLEKTYTLALAEEVRASLVRAGFEVVMTRDSDAYVDLTERTAIARRHGADLFVSLHHNASRANPAARGIEVYALTPPGVRSTNDTNDTSDVGPLHATTGNACDPQNLLLAYAIQRCLIQDVAEAVDRGVRRARFAVLRLAEMPAVLVEAGFLSHPGDSRWICSDDGRRKTAEAVVKGIRRYKDLLEPSPSTASK